MFKSSQASIDKWANIRAKGRSRFIFINGMIFWGIPTGLFWSVFMLLTTKNQNPFFLFTLALILFPLGGIGWGAWVWHMSEKRYNAANPPHA